MFCGIKLEGCIYIDLRFRVFDVHLPFKLFFFFALSQIPHTYTFKQFSNTTILNFFWYLPSLYLYDTIDCRNGWYSRPFLSIRFSFDNIIFLFHESKYNWKILSTFLKNHFAILLNICHLMYENNVDLISYTFCRCLMVYFTLMFSIKFIHTHCMNICT